MSFLFWVMPSVTWSVLSVSVEGAMAYRLLKDPINNHSLASESASDYSFTLSPLSGPDRRIKISFEARLKDTKYYVPSSYSVSPDSSLLWDFAGSIEFQKNEWSLSLGGRREGFDRLASPSDPFEVDSHYLASWFAELQIPLLRGQNSLLYLRGAYDGFLPEGWRVKGSVGAEVGQWLVTRFFVDYSTAAAMKPSSDSDAFEVSEFTFGISLSLHFNLKIVRRER